MRDSELDAAGITDPRLRQAYQRCRTLNAQHGKTYFLATRLLPRERRPAVHALYGFARHADDIVDEPQPPDSTGDRKLALAELRRALLSGLDQGGSDDDLLAATVHTVARYGLDRALFEDFLESMRMDLTVTDYPDRAALNRYMRGSAEAIGLQLLPVLGTTCPPERAAPRAAALGKAFQLTNFLRDVAEDLDRDRVYLPADELAAHGVDRELLTWCRRHRRTDPRVRRALVEQHATTREVYRYARAGIALLEPVSRPCVETAFTLYSRILDCIEAEDFAVFRVRATVGRWHRIRVATSGLTRSALARRTSRAPRAGHERREIA
ncbi:phytoene/squalene synthase family protein [Saccharopolyspora rhizosphaerae]|uniref:Phytoene/squalene synthase family protein n=1 Tax=Saccharopolyspora rhizosphaerae TaxID=2492662 RepID=A0A3R8P5F5_9PSEU|nr:phytoene/squalene synthase family protein [Saccharopolyspora rhizosphaerae]RRO16906.1 phytoene/squalene synthase family protein [Saccharopolyspora rhizosphaerae]